MLHRHASLIWKTTFGRVEKHINILVNDDVRNLGDPSLDRGDGTGGAIAPSIYANDITIIAHPIFLRAKYREASPIF